MNTSVTTGSSLRHERPASPAQGARVELPVFAGTAGPAPAHGPRIGRRGWLLFTGSLTLAMAGCGFRLRRNAQLPFHRLYTNLSLTSGIGLALRREMAHAEGSELVTDAKEADVRLLILQESPEREVVAYSPEGRAREYELRLRVRFKAMDAQGNDLIPDSEIVLRREISNADNQLTARADEEAMLFRDMSTDMAHQLMRRLAAIRPPGAG
ncbi:MAG: LPS assembly lipoprotein LptE [Lautropia sp.]|nr:LPS assembly lipoprotein LptE [Lautropia sp.]